MELTKEFSPEQYEFALESWTFLDFTGLTPHFTSLFGDVFFQAPDATWWYLDLVAGTLLPEWPNAKEMVEDLQTDAGQDRYLLAPVALAAARAGLVPDEVQIYDFAHSPLEGGRVEVDNLVLADFITAVNLIGVLHREIQERAAQDDEGPELDALLESIASRGAASGDGDRPAS
jgi:hypothetical protein